LSSSDVSGNGRAREEPHGDTTIDPLHRVYTSTVAVESGTEAIIIGGVGETAASVRVIARSAVGIGKLAAGCLGVIGSSSTTWVCMERALVLGLAIDSFDNVNLTARWPVGTVCPEGGPRSAAGESIGHLSGTRLPR
jgi:hypothetical protein